jgi:hypothetical protein
MRFLLLSLFIVSNLFALNDVSKPYNFLPRDTLKSSKFNANYDTLYLRINQNNDSVDNSFIRFYDLEKHDSTLKYLAVDTIRSNPNIDSITGNVIITGSPTITGTLTANALSGPLTGNVTGNISGNVTGGTVSGSTGTFSGALSSTTLNTGNGANELYPMNQDVQTTASPTFVKVTSTRDSTQDIVATDSIKGVTGTFSGTVKVDSLNSTKGITTTGRFVGTDLQATDTVKGVSGTFSGTVSGDSSVTNGSRVIGDLKFSGIGSLSTGNYLSLTGALSTGRLSSGSTNSLNSISTYLDSKALELSVGSTSGFVSGILLSARSYTGTDADGITFWTRSTKRVTIDGATGSATFTSNLGIGHAPSAWLSTYKAAEQGTGFSAGSVASSESYFGANAYISDLGWRSVITGASSFIRCKGDAIEWYFSPSVSAGSVQSPVQKAILDSNGIFSANVGNFDSITTNGTDYMTYNDTTFYDSLYDGSTYRARGLCRLIQVGKQITMYQPSLFGTITAGQQTQIRGIPSKYLGGIDQFTSLVTVLSNSVVSIGKISFGSFVVIDLLNAELSAGYGGIYNTQLTWQDY